MLYIDLAMRSGAHDRLACRTQVWVHKHTELDTFRAGMNEFIQSLINSDKTHNKMHLSS